MTRRDVPPRRSGIGRDEDDEITSSLCRKRRRRHWQDSEWVNGSGMGSEHIERHRGRCRECSKVETRRIEMIRERDTQMPSCHGSCAGLGHFAPTRARVAVEVIYEVVRHLMDGT